MGRAEIELGRQGAVGTNAGGGSVRARCNVSARKKGEGENEHGSMWIRTGARGSLMTDAWWSPALFPVDGMGARMASLESTVTELNSFEMILTKV